MKFHDYLGEDEMAFLYFFPRNNLSNLSLSVQFNFSSHVDLFDFIFFWFL